MKKLSRLIKVFSIFAIFLCSGFLFCACNKHVHAFSEWSVTTEATCTEEGERQRVCECGEVETEKIAAKGHTFGDWQTKTSATCTQAGTEERECSVCHTKEERDVAALGHKVVIQDGYAPTCGVPGLTEGRYCEICNEVFATQDTIPALEHVYGNWYPVGDVVVGDTIDGVEQCNGTHRRDCKNPGCQSFETGVCTYDTTPHPATCTEGGYNIHTCTTCNYSFRHDEVEMLGHNFSGRIEVDENNHQHHKVFCTNSGCTEFESVACEFEKTSHTDKKCLVNGYDTYDCKYCTNTYNVTKPEDIATGHQYGDTWQPDVDHPGHHMHECSVCHEKEHVTCDERIEIKEATCEEGGYKKTICDTCGNEVLNETYDMLPHSWGPWSYTGETKETRRHSHTCINCPKTEEFACSDWVTEETDATCEAAGTIVEYCPICKGGFTTEGQPAKSHNFSQWEHDPDNPEYHKHYCLNGCGKEESEPCQNTASITPEDCVNDGKTTYTCSYCHNTYDEVRPKLGHLWVEEGSEFGAGEWEIDEQAGTHTRRCKRAECGVVETGTHTYIESNLCDSCKHDGLVYEVRDGYAVVVHDDAVAGAKRIIIANTYNGYPVEEICSGLQKYEVGKLAGFYANKTVEEVVLPSNLRKICSYAFTSCPNLRSVTCEANCALTTIEEFAFNYCPKLTEMQLPSKLTTIANSAFRSCEKLENITVPEGVLHIGAYAFYGTAFMKKWERSSDDVLYVNGHLIKVKNSIAGTYTIESGTKTISAEAFKDCRLLSSIVIPSSIIESDQDAFLGCTGLETIIFLGSFDEWISIAFANDNASPMCNCDHIEIKGAKDTVTLSSNITKIPAGAFKGTSIKHIKIPASVTYIGEEAFENCTELEIEFDENCRFTYIGENAFTGSKFYNETNLWKNGVLYVGHCLACVNEEFTASEYTIEEGTISISPNAFGTNTTLTSLVLPGSLQFIGKGAFKNCHALAKAKFLGNTSWFAFMEQGAGRMPSSSMLAGGGSSEEEINHNLKETARMLRDMYTGEWKRSL